MEPQKHKPKHTNNKIENKENNSSLQHLKTMYPLPRREILIITCPEQYKKLDKRSMTISK